MCEINNDGRQYGEIIPIKTKEKLSKKQCCGVELLDAWRLGKLKYCPKCGLVYYDKERI